MKLSKVNCNFWFIGEPPEEDRLVAEMALQFKPGPIRKAIMNSKIIIDYASETVEAVFEKEIDIDDPYIALMPIDIPRRTQETIDNYVKNKLKPGGFVEACLAHDFIRAIQMCDPENLRKLKKIVDYILEFVPFEIQGSYEKIFNHLGKNYD